MPKKKKIYDNPAAYNEYSGNHLIEKPEYSEAILSDDVGKLESMLRIANGNGSDEDLKRAYNGTKPKVSLTESERNYIQLRIDSLNHIKELEEQKKKQEKQFELNVKNTDGGAELEFKKIPPVQSSDYGCWSVSLSVLLQSKGVTLDQQEIRSFRPNFSVEDKKGVIDAHDNFIKKVNRNPMDSSDYQIMGSDVMGNSFQYAGLIQKLVPNTAVHNAVYKRPFIHSADVKADLLDTVKTAITQYKSPVSYLAGNHFRTIIGYNEKKGFFKVIDSFVPRELEVSIDSIVRADQLDITWMEPLTVTKDGKVVGISPKYQGVNYVKGELQVGAAYNDLNSTMQKENRVLHAHYDENHPSPIEKDEAYMLPTELVLDPKIKATQKWTGLEAKEATKDGKYLIELPEKDLVTQYSMIMNRLMEEIVGGKQFASLLALATKCSIPVTDYPKSKVGYEQSISKFLAKYYVPNKNISGYSDAMNLIYDMQTITEALNAQSGVLKENENLKQICNLLNQDIKDLNVACRKAMWYEAKKGLENNNPTNLTQAMVDEKTKSIENQTLLDCNKKNAKYNEELIIKRAERIKAVREQTPNWQYLINQLDESSHVQLSDYAGQMEQEDIDRATFERQQREEEKRRLREQQQEENRKREEERKLKEEEEKRKLDEENRKKREEEERKREEENRKKQEEEIRKRDEENRKKQEEEERKRKEQDKLKQEHKEETQEEEKQDNGYESVDSNLRDSLGLKGYDVKVRKSQLDPPLQEEKQEEKQDEHSILIESDSDFDDDEEEKPAFEKKPIFEENQEEKPLIDENQEEKSDTDWLTKPQEKEKAVYIDLPTGQSDRLPSEQYESIFDGKLKDMNDSVKKQYQGMEVEAGANILFHYLRTAKEMHDDGYFPGKVDSVKIDSMIWMNTHAKNQLLNQRQFNEYGKTVTYNPYWTRMANILDADMEILKVIKSQQRINQKKNAPAQTFDQAILDAKKACLNREKYQNNPDSAEALDRIQKFEAGAEARNTKRVNDAFEDVQKKLATTDDSCFYEIWKAYSKVSRQKGSDEFTQMKDALKKVADIRPNSYKDMMEKLVNIQNAVQNYMNKKDEHWYNHELVAEEKRGKRITDSGQARYDFAKSLCQTATAMLAKYKANQQILEQIKGEVPAAANVMKADRHPVGERYTMGTAKNKLATLRSELQNKMFKQVPGGNGATKFDPKEFNTVDFSRYMVLETLISKNLTESIGGMTDAILDNFAERMSHNHSMKWVVQCLSGNEKNLDELVQMTHYCEAELRKHEKISKMNQKEVEAYCKVLDAKLPKIDVVNEGTDEERHVSKIAPLEQLSMKERVDSLKLKEAQEKVETLKKIANYHAMENAIMATDPEWKLMDAEIKKMQEQEQKLEQIQEPLKRSNSISYSETKIEKQGKEIFGRQEIFGEHDANFGYSVDDTDSKVKSSKQKTDDSNPVL